jgi:phosphosulfolactate synthase
VDVVTVDPSRPSGRAGGAFIEVNTTPGIHHHYHTDEERRTHPVAVRVLRRLLGADDPPMAITPRTPTMITHADAPPAPGRLHTADYLQTIGVRKLPAALSPFDPGYDPATVESHLEQSHHLMSMLKISMACWLVADERATRRKIDAARRWSVPVVTGGGPFEIAVQQGALDAYLDLCADLGVARIECGEGFTDMPLEPVDVVRMIHARGMEAQFEMGKKHGGAFTSDVVDGLIEQGRRWMDAGALQLVVEARESARGVGLFDDDGAFNPGYADRFAGAFGLDALIFEAPNKPSQFALLEHFGTRVHLCNVRLEEVLRVEIYRRGLHSDAFGSARLRPPVPVPGVVRFAGIREG